MAVTQRDRYVEAMALLNGSRSLASVGGPTIGGLLVQVLGAPIAMFADSLSFLGSVFFLRRIRSPEPPIEADEGTTRERLLAGLSFVLGDRIMRPTLLSVATDQPVHVRRERAVHPVRDDDARGLAGRPRPGARDRRDRRRDRGDLRVADRAADRARAGLRAWLRALPGVAAADPAGRAGDVDAADPGAALRLGVRGGSRGHDPRHQRRGDHLRADAGPDPRPGGRRVPVHQLRRPPDRRAARRGAGRAARGSRGDRCSATIAGDWPGCCS